MKQFTVSAWETDYKIAHIEAHSVDEARRIAQASLSGERDDVYWKSTDHDTRVEDVEES